MKRLLQLAALVLCLVRGSALAPHLFSESELVDIVENTLQKRDGSDRSFRFKVFGEDFEINLKKSEDFLPETLPVQFIDVDDQGNIVVDDFTHRTGLKPLYGDTDMLASVILHELDGSTSLLGSLNGSLVIKPEVHDIRPFPQIHKHRIYRTNITNDYAKNNKPLTGADKKIYARSEKRQLPSKIWIPVHAVIDPSHFRHFGKSEHDIIDYAKTIFHTAQISHFSTMTNPTAQLTLHGIIVCKTEDACPELRNALRAPNEIRYGSNSLSKFAYQMRTRTGTDYAIMFFLTMNKICSDQGCGIAGWGQLGGACAGFSDQSQISYRDGIMMDHGGYDGVKGIGHEIGHLLNMPHDGDPETSSCRGGTSEGDFIMGQTQWSLNNFRFSRCSMDKLRSFLGESRSNCLKQAPKKDEIGGWNFAHVGGKKMSYDNQCRAVWNMVSCHSMATKNDWACRKLGCSHSPGGKCSEFHEPPAEGTPCGPGLFCHRGECVADMGSGGGGSSGSVSLSLDAECKRAWGGDHFNCIPLNFKNDKACNTLGCKRPDMNWCGESPRKAADGTQCGPGNVCRGGECVADMASSGGGSSGSVTLSLDAECKRSWGGDHSNCMPLNFKNDKACNTLGCKRPDMNWCGESPRVAADGTQCGPGNTCRGGRCV